MPDTATKPGTVTPETTPPEPALTRPRGRHRKPRPRRILFAVGSLALAAGALSLLRMAPQPTGGDTGMEATDIDPSAAGSTDNPARDDAGAVPVAAPPTTGASPSPTATTGPSGSTSTSEPNRLNGRDEPSKPNGSYGPPGASAPGAQRGATGPAGPRDPAPNPSGDLQDTVPITTTPPARPPAATPTAPAPTPTSLGAPQNPARPGTGLCVPVVGLCFDGNDSNNR
ncbi:hypothetical protein QF035_004128 [Streptomyces umbrinus]|uniref:Translation initiation factor IF-2 n=1 Tax=Streptomyces umbrinus TaxID=67370 RepID=A0ABU0SUX8_9ACTN|nr:hypothetical protein [Streptomyces umbrinus]MDQ1026546.1 hypothetical protein [Streptomyces umbrinus]